jgi:hypothetical protein
MSKKHPKVDTASITRRLAWEASVAEIRDGRRQRAATFTDRKKEASRKACRGRFV